MRNAKVLRKAFTPREGFDPSELHAGDDGAHLVLAGGGALGGREGRARRSSTAPRSPRRRSGSAEWLVGEVVSYRGEAIVLEPHELRARVAQRARELANELPPRARAKA